MLGFLNVNISKHSTELPAGLQAISKSTVFYGWNTGNLDVVCIFDLKLKPNLKRKQRLSECTVYLRIQLKSSQLRMQRIASVCS